VRTIRFRWWLFALRQLTKDTFQLREGGTFQVGDTTLVSLLQDYIDKIVRDEKAFPHTHTHVHTRNQWPHEIGDKNFSPDIEHFCERINRTN